MPLVEPRSRTMARSPSQRISTCLRLVPASAMVMSASLPRPITVRAFVSGCRLPSMSTTAAPGDPALGGCRVDAQRSGRQAGRRARIEIETGPAKRVTLAPWRASARGCRARRRASSRVPLIFSSSAGERRTDEVVGGEDAVAADDRGLLVELAAAARRRSRPAGCRCGRSSRTRRSRRARDPSRSCQVVPRDSSGRQTSRDIVVAQPGGAPNPVHDMTGDRAVISSGG